MGPPHGQRLAKPVRKGKPDSRDSIKFQWSDNRFHPTWLDHFKGFHFRQAPRNWGLLSALTGHRPNNVADRMYEVAPDAPSSFPAFNFARVDGSVSVPETFNVPIHMKLGWTLVWGYRGSDYAP